MKHWWRRTQDAWWIDFLEKELDPTLQQDLRLLLSHSSLDAKILANYMKLKRAVKASDRAKPPENSEYYDSLHAKIMAGVNEQIATDAATEERVRANRPVVWLGGAFIALLLASALVLRVQQRTATLHRLPHDGDAAADVIVEASVIQPDTFSDTAMSYEVDNDLINEAAAQALDHLSPEQIKSFLDQI
jgi:hypothetical protein